MSNVLARSGDRFAAGGGAALAAATSAIGRALDRTKPLHPDGVLLPARLSVIGTGTGPESGVPFLDEAAEYGAVARFSRAVGLPRPLPDIAGLALRTHLPDGPADLLLASTGTGPITRFLLAPRLPRRPGPLTTLLPYRAPTGAVVLGAAPVSEHTYALHWSRGTASWNTFALLHLGAGDADAPLSFDPVRNSVPGLDQYPWVRRLRAPAYHRARARSGRTVDGSAGPRRG